MSASEVPALRPEEGDLQLIQAISENFWSQFCYDLRLHPRAHENLPVQTKKVWMEALASDVPSLLGEFSDLLERAVDQVPSLEDDETVGEALCAYREGRERVDDLQNATDAWLEGLEEFSREPKSAYGR